MSAPAQAPRVVIAGGGVAALEAVLALRSVIDQQVTIELLSPQERFTYRPLTVLEPFAGQEAWSFELERFAADQDVRYRQDGLAEVDARGHVALTQGGEELPYSALLLATGTRMHEWLPGALTFGTPGSSEAVRELVEDLELGTVQRVAYAVPPREGWMLPVYELALLTATHLAERGIADRELTLVTPEDEPLAAFGQRASIAVRTLLEQHGIALRTDRYPTAFDAGTLHLVPDGELAVERVVTLPRLEGVPIPGVPHDPEGFVHIDEHGAVDGLQDVYAAGDMTTFPIKQGGIATQMADAAAEAILAQLGLPIEPRPFRLPWARRGLARQIEGGLQGVCRGLRPGELTCGARTQFEVQKERGMRAGTVRGSAGHEQDRVESARLPGEDVDHLDLRRRHALSVNGDKHRTQFHPDFSIGVGFVGEGHPPADHVGPGNPILG